jgi:hypothetical protein
MIKTEELKCERSEFYNELLKDKTDIFTEFGKEMYSSIYVEGYPLYKMVVFFNNKTKQVTKKGIGGETFALVEFSPNNYKSIRDLYAKASFEKEYIPKLIKEIIIKIKNKCKKEFKIVFSLDDEEQRFNITKHRLLSSGYFLANDFNGEDRYLAITHFLNNDDYEIWKLKNFDVTFENFQISKQDFIEFLDKDFESFVLMNETLCYSYRLVFKLCYSLSNPEKMFNLLMSSEYDSNASITPKFFIADEDFRLVKFFKAKGLDYISLLKKTFDFFNDTEHQAYAYIEQMYKIFPEFICMLSKEKEEFYILYNGSFYFNISVFSSVVSIYKDEFDDKIKLYIDNLMEVKGSFVGTIDFTIHSETLDIIYNNINTLDLFISQSKYDEIQALITVINSNYNRLSYSDSPEEDALVVKALKVIMDNVTIKDGITSENSFLCKL